MSLPYSEGATTERRQGSSSSSLSGSKSDEIREVADKWNNKCSMSCEAQDTPQGGSGSSSLLKQIGLGTQGIVAWILAVVEDRTSW